MEHGTITLIHNLLVETLEFLGVEQKFKVNLAAVAAFATLIYRLRFLDDDCNECRAKILRNSSMPFDGAQIS